MSFLLEAGLCAGCHNGSIRGDIGTFCQRVDKLRRIVKHTAVILSVRDSLSNVIDWFWLQSSYQGLEARIRNSKKKNPNMGKLVNIAQAEVQRTPEAIDRAGRELLNRIDEESVVSVQKILVRMKISTPIKQER